MGLTKLWRRMLWIMSGTFKTFVQSEVYKQIKRLWHRINSNCTVHTVFTISSCIRTIWQIKLKFEFKISWLMTIYLNTKNLLWRIEQCTFNMDFDYSQSNLSLSVECLSELSLICWHYHMDWFSGDRSSWSSAPRSVSNKLDASG